MFREFQLIKPDILALKFRLQLLELFIMVSKVDMMLWKASIYTNRSIANTATEYFQQNVSYATKLKKKDAAKTVDRNKNEICFPASFTQERSSLSGISTCKNPCA